MTRPAGNANELDFCVPVSAYTTKMHNTSANNAGKVFEEYSTCLDANSPPPAVFHPIAFHPTQEPINSTEVCHSIGANSNATAAVAFQQTADCLTAAYGTKWNGNASATNGSLFAAQPMVLMDQGGSVMNVEHDMVGTLRRETHGHEPVVMQPVGCFKGGQGSGAGGIGYSEHVAPTLPASDGGNRTPTLLNAMSVRRLTPIECERLQGFPDNYTNIPWRKKDESPDGPRYKALGNSWAVPVVAWLGKRINEAVK
jgi:site-specific DNA-cytosine methylase